LRGLGASVAAAPGEAVYASSSTAATHIADSTPAVRQIKKRLVKYKRADGVELLFTLYMPPGYKEGTHVLTIL
jgi:dipeptidyl aminopeptidase/acylaminoacyl peptidase